MYFQEKGKKKSIISVHEAKRTLQLKNLRVIINNSFVSRRKNIIYKTLYKHQMVGCLTEGELTEYILMKRRFIY